MSPEDRTEFQAEMGVGGTDRDAVIRTLLKTSRQRLFLTAGEKEVRTWLLHEGGTALDAAARSTPIWPRVSSAPRSSTTAT